MFFPTEKFESKGGVQEKKKGEVLTKRQGHTQSRKPLDSEWSSVFPIVQRCGGQPREDGGQRREEAGRKDRTNEALRDCAGGKVMEQEEEQRD